MDEPSWSVGAQGAAVRWTVLALTLLALAYLLLFTGAFGLPTGWRSAGGVAAYVLIHLGAIVLILALLAAYILDVVANARLSWTGRTVWIVALALGNVLAMPVYWLVHLRRGRRRTDLALPA